MHNQTEAFVLEVTDHGDVVVWGGGLFSVYAYESDVVVRCKNVGLEFYLNFEIDFGEPKCTVDVVDRCF